MYITEDCKNKPYGSDIILDKLVDSKNLSDKIAAVKQNYELDKLIYDKSWEVRQAVAKQGYGLDIRINDEESIIRNTVYDYLKEHNLTIEEWCIQEGKNYSGLIEYLIKIFSIINTLNFVKVETDSDLSIKEFFNDLSNESYEENDFIYVAPIDIRQILFKIEKSIENNNKVFKFIVKISENSFSYNIIVNITSKDIFHKILTSTLAILHEYTPLTKYICEIEDIL